MKKLLPLLSAVSVIGAATVSHAATIDFANATTAALANGKTSYTYTDVSGTDVDVTVAAGGVYGAKIAAQSGTGLLADGIGVTSYADTRGNAGSFIPDDWESTKDEINGSETLTVSFSTAVTIESVQLTDLYASPDTGSYTWVPDETGKWTLKDSTGKSVASGDFTGVEQRNPNGSSSTTLTPTNGVLSINIAEVASGIVFRSTNTGAETQYKGFSIASISFNDGTPTGGVPELSGTGAAGAALLLAGIGVLFMGDGRRRGLRPVT